MSSLFSTTHAYHALLDELFLLHQEAILAREYTLVTTSLLLFKQWLTAHLELEDELFLPALSRHCPEPRWRPELYRKEHQKILKLLEELDLRVREFGIESGRRDIIRLLDHQRRFKGLLEHHEEREEKGLLKELDEYLPLEDLEALLLQCQQRWQALPEMNGQLQAIAGILDNVKGSTV